MVAQRGDLVITETRHGFVCANAGVDASNVVEGMLTLLPEDPDGSAARLREDLVGRTSARRLGVVITDTFGRPWREGLVDVAIGVAGMPAIVDLRGYGGPRRSRCSTRRSWRSPTRWRRRAGARDGQGGGRSRGGGPRARTGTAKGGDAHDLVRAPELDLFRESPLQALHARRTIRSFGAGHRSARRGRRTRSRPPAPRPHPTTRARGCSRRSTGRRRSGLRWPRSPTRGAPTFGATARPRRRSNGGSRGATRCSGEAPMLIVPFVRFAGAHPYPDAERAGAEREMFLLSGGAAIQNLLLGLHARSVASCWISSTLFCQEETRAVLGVDQEWHALGTVACGPMPEGGASRPRPPVDLDRVPALVLGEQPPHEVADEQDRHDVRERVHVAALALEHLDQRVGHEPRAPRRS